MQGCEAATNPHAKAAEERSLEGEGKYSLHCSGHY
jgi:hypothetical protein